MVASPRTALRAGGGASDVDQLRALNAPRSVRVTCDAPGQPRAVLLDSGWTAVAEVVDEWRVEEEWWRTPIRRRYLQIMLADGRLMTLFEDLQDPSEGRWYRQHTGNRA